MDNWIEAALESGEDKHLRLSDVKELIRSNKAQVWPGEGGVLVTQLLETPDGRYLHCWLGGGEMEALLSMRAGVEAWGRQQGAQFASINGRRGWDRIFQKYGYRRENGELVKRL